MKKRIVNNKTNEKIKNLDLKSRIKQLHKKQISNKKVKIIGIAATLILIILLSIYFMPKIAFILLIITC